MPIAIITSTDDISKQAIDLTPEPYFPFQGNTLHFITYYNF